jgi:hypothetical protein
MNAVPRPDPRVKLLSLTEWPVTPPNPRGDPYAQQAAALEHYRCENLKCSCQSGRNVHCPMAAYHRHGDRRPSLSIYVRDNALRVKSHLKCCQGANKAVIAYLGRSGLWQGKAVHARPVTYKDVTIVRHYDYGPYSVARTIDKQFPVYHQTRSGWKWGWRGPWNLYHLPELLAADAAEYRLLCEGEKDVQSAEHFGFIATTTPLGAGKAHLCDLSPLYDRHVVILPDQDAAGRQDTREKRRLLSGKAASLRIVNVPIGKDVADYFVQADHRNANQRLRELIDATLPVKRRGPKASKLEAAIAKTRELLGDGEESPADWYTKAMVRAGISAKTAERARKHLGVSARKDGPDGFWLLSLPNPRPPSFGDFSKAAKFPNAA